MGLKVPNLCHPVEQRWIASRLKRECLICRIAAATYSTVHAATMEHSTMSAQEQPRFINFRGQINP